MTDSVWTSSDEPTTVHVRRARDGDVRSISWLVERFTPWLSVQARARVGAGLVRHVDPEDLVQDTWLIALRRLPDLDDSPGRRTPRLLRFLATTLLRRAQDLVEHHLRRRAPSGEAVSPDDVRASVTDALAHSIRKERSERLHRAIDGLAEAERELVVLRGIEGHSYSALVAVLGDAENTLAQRYRRALQRLRLTVDSELLEDLDNPAD